MSRRELVGDLSFDPVDRPASVRPELAYDGDCGLCGYWQKLTAGQWWNRRLARLYFPKARLKTEGE